MQATAAMKKEERIALTERDLEIVRFIGRVGVAEARQVAARWQREDRRHDGATKGMPQSNAYRRLRGLEAFGLLERRRLLHGEPAVFLATRDGLRLAGLELGPRKVSAGGVTHATEATWLALSLEEEFGERRVVMEREIRARDGAAERPAYAVEAGGPLPGGRRRLHFPDLAIEAANGEGPLCVELELTAKGRRRLAEILRAYVRGRHVGGVRYYVAPRAERQLREAIATTRADPLVEVRPLASAGARSTRTGTEG